MVQAAQDGTVKYMENVTEPFMGKSEVKVKVTVVSDSWTPWTIQSVDFSRPESWKRHAINYDIIN